MHDVIELARRVAARLGGADGVEAVALGGVWAYPEPPFDAALDLYLYHRAGEPPTAEALTAALRELREDVADAAVPALDASSPGPATWLWIEGRRIALHLRDLDAVARAVEGGLAGVLGGAHAYGPAGAAFAPTLMGEVHDARPLHDPLGTLGDLRELTDPYPFELRRAVMTAFDDEADRTLFAAQQAAGQDDLYFAAQALARGVACLVQVLFAANGRYLAFDRAVLPRLRTLPDQPADAAGVVARALGATPGAGSLDARIDDLRALAGEIRLRYVQPLRAGA